MYMATQTEYIMSKCKIFMKKWVDTAGSGEVEEKRVGSCAAFLHMGEY